MREEILAGLKNAIEHGSSLDSAVQSFINAGYSPSEVKEAAGSLSDLGIDSQNSNSSYSQTSQLNTPSNPNPGPEIPELPTQLQRNNPMPSELVFNNQKPQSNNGIIIAIIFSLLIFLGSLGYLIYVLFLSK